MKDNNQTPQNEEITNRRYKESRLKKPHKIVKKSLTGAFNPVSEDVSSDLTKELTDLSPVSEISESNCSSQITQSSDLVSTTSEAFALYNPSPTSKIASNNNELDNLSTEHSLFQKLDSSVEVDIVSKFLKQARNQVLNSNDVGPQSKKLLDALLKVVLDEFYSLPEETDRYSELVSTKFCLVFLCFFIWSFLAYVIFIVSRLDSSYGGFSPT